MFLLIWVAGALVPVYVTDEELNRINHRHFNYIDIKANQLESVKTGSWSEIEPRNQRNKSANWDV